MQPIAQLSYFVITTDIVFLKFYLVIKSNMHNYDYISKYYKLEFNYENYCNYRVKWLSTRIIKEKISIDQDITIKGITKVYKEFI